MNEEYLTITEEEYWKPFLIAHGLPADETHIQACIQANNRGIRIEQKRIYLDFDKLIKDLIFQPNVK